MCPDNSDVAEKNVVKIHWPKKNKHFFYLKWNKPAGMYEWLAVTFRVAVVSQSIVENYPVFSPPQDSPSVSSMEVKR